MIFVPESFAYQRFSWVYTLSVGRLEKWTMKIDSQVEGLILADTMANFTFDGLDRSELDYAGNGSRYSR